MVERKPGLRNFDWQTLPIVIALCAVGLATLYSTSGAAVGEFRYLKRQLTWMIFGLVVIVGVSFTDYDRIGRYAWALYGVSLFLLVLVALVGRETWGAKRWLQLGPVSVQPSELAKIGSIIAVARYLSKRGKDAKKPLSVAVAFVIAGA